jgi:hypothetical protein
MRYIALLTLRDLQVVVIGFSGIVVRRMRCHRLLPPSVSWLFAAVALFWGGCADKQKIDTARFIPTAGIPRKTEQIPVLSVKLARAYPHDPHAFTQGLEYFGGYLYESTGIAGESTLRKVALETGQVLQN